MAAGLAFDSVWIFEKYCTTLLALWYFLWALGWAATKTWKFLW